MDTAEVKTIHFKSIDNLVFDPLNPRIPSSVISGQDEAEVVNWMLKDASIVELMGSIGEKGFFPAEPLLVVKRTDSDDFEVVEGNRRLTAAKLLVYPELATKRSDVVRKIVGEAKIHPKELPVFIYDTREEILDYLGFKHITGVKSWSALAKAKYLKELQAEYVNQDINEQYKSLAKSIGSRSDYVRELLIGLSVYDQIKANDFFDIEELKEEKIEFGVYYNALRWSNIVEFLNVEKAAENPTENIKIENLKELCQWVSKRNNQNVTRLGESRNLSKLNSVLAKSSLEAIEAFRSGKTLDESLIYTEEPLKIFQSSLLNSLNNLKTANQSLHHIPRPQESDYTNLTEIASITRDLRLLVKAKMEADDEDEV